MRSLYAALVRGFLLEEPMYLSPHFTLEELTKSQLALRLGLKNVPSDTEIGNLTRLARDVLEPVRAHYDQSFAPSSGYRSPTLNSRLGSGPGSQHVRGEAVDFEVPGISNLALARWIADNIAFDQLILEFHDPRQANSGWVHCSLTGTSNRSEILTIERARHGGRTRNGLPADIQEYS